jgi:GTP cyclohydrolase I
MTDYFDPTFAECRMAAEDMADRIKARGLGVSGVYGVPQGGLFPAMIVSERLGLPLCSEPERGATVVVDDLVDSGNTLTAFANLGYYTDALYRKPWSPAEIAPKAAETDKWIRFPWERDGGAPTDAVVRILQHIGEDPSRDGLLDTPKRVIKAMTELTAGYKIDAAEVLSTTFDVTHDEMIVVRGVPFSSLCEHHMLPFHGHATVAYIPGPGGRIVGLSKLARLVDMYARRLQVQERMTDQIADAVDEYLSPVGVGVIVTASHSCMSMRGIQKHGEMVTAKMIGAMRDKPEARAELMALHRD